MGEGPGDELSNASLSHGVGTMPYWRGYWEQQSNGKRRRQTEDFLEKEAKEKLFHLDGGESLLDFGCGSADLLCYLAGAYRRVVGVDFSLAMLRSARERLASRGLHDVTLIHADETSVWERLRETETFDRITAAGVVQYLTIPQLMSFLGSASGRLSNTGKIALFDVIDPRTYWLFRIGAFGIRNGRGPSFLRLLRGAVRASRAALVRRLKRLPTFEEGYSYHPGALATMGHSCGLQTECICSMYYEYRYHAIMGHQRPSPGS